MAPNFRGHILGDTLHNATIARHSHIVVSVTFLDEWH